MQAIRGHLWKVFLDVAGKARPGVYDKLVSQALGKPFSGKVSQTNAVASDNILLLL